MHGLAKFLFGKTYGKSAVVPTGTAFPAAPIIGSLFFRIDELKLYIFIGVGEPGTTSGWFNLKYAQYSA